MRSMRDVRGSGAVTAGGPIATPVGKTNPVIKEAFTVAPEVVYSPMVLLPLLAAKRSEPDIAIPNAKSRPKIKEAFTVAPVRWCIRLPWSGLHRW